MPIVSPPLVSGAPDFGSALPDLQQHLPSWWRTADPTSQLYMLLAAVAVQIDAIAVLWENPYLDQVLSTASLQGLFHNFAYAWAVQQEQLPPTVGQLSAYITARASEDGSIQSLVNTLTSLVNTPVNITGGPVLAFSGPLLPSTSLYPSPSIYPSSFPAGLVFPDPAGSNLVFPMSGGVALPATFGGQAAGLVTFEFALGGQPTGGLFFPAGSGGLIFPIFPSSTPSDNVIVQDGTFPIGAGPGLIFASNGFISIIQNFTTYTFIVQVQNWLAFDRAAFARAVARFQPSHCLPATITEVSSYV